MLRARREDRVRLGAGRRVSLHVNGYLVRRISPSESRSRDKGKGNSNDYSLPHNPVPFLWPPWWPVWLTGALSPASPVSKEAVTLHCLYYITTARAMTTKKGGWQGHPPSSSRIYYLNMLLISPHVLGCVAVGRQGSSPTIAADAGAGHAHRDIQVRTRRRGAVDHADVTGRRIRNRANAAGACRNQPARTERNGPAGLAGRPGNPGALTRVRVMPPTARSPLHLVQLIVSPLSRPSKTEPDRAVLKPDRRTPASHRGRPGQPRCARCSSTS